METDKHNPIGRKAVYDAIDERHRSEQEAIEQEWSHFRSQFTLGQRISGKVIREEPFGVLLDIGGQFLGLLEIMNIAAPEGVDPKLATNPRTGEIVTARIVQFCDQNKQIRLSQK